MAEIKNFPNNVDEYIGAQNVMKWLHGRTSGVFGADGNLSVTSNGDMTVSVSDGVGWLANDKADGTVFWNDTKEQTGSELQLEISLADAVLPRIDRVVVSWDTVDYAAKPRIEVLKGTAAATPAAPELTNNSLLRQISLVQIAIPASASKITADNITDERLDSTVCGLVTDWINVDTNVMQEQFAAFLTQIKTELEQLNAGTATMLRVTYDPQNKQTDIFKEIENVRAQMPYPYQASLPVSGWSSLASSNDNYEKGYRYTQTVTLTKVVSTAPSTYSTSVFFGGPTVVSPNNTTDNEAALEALNIINRGNATLLGGTSTSQATFVNKIYIVVDEKPKVDVTIQWPIMKG